MKLPFKKTLSILLSLILVFGAFIILPTTAHANVVGGGNHTFYIGQSSESNEFLTSAGIDRPIITQDMPAGIGVAGGDRGMMGKSFKGTALPGKAGTYTVKVTDEYGADEKSFTMTIAPGPQTIVQSNISKKMSDGNFTVTPHSINGNTDMIQTGSTDAPVYTFSGNTNPAAATIDAAGNVTLVGPGSTNVTVYSGATNSYLEATNNGNGTLTFAIIVSKADPAISASNQTATLGVAKTVTATLAGAYLAGGDSITFTATSGTVSVPATATANGNVNFNLSATDINTLGLGTHTFAIAQPGLPVNVAMNNNTIAPAQFTLTVNTPTYSGGGWYVPPTTQKPPASVPTPFPAQGTVTGKRITAYMLDTLKGKMVFRLNKNEQFTLLELAANGKALLIQKGDIKGYIAIKDFKATFGAQLKGTATAKKASVYTVQANGKLKRIGHYPTDTIIGINGVDGGYLISSQPGVTYYLKAGEWQFVK